MAKTKISTLAKDLNVALPTVIEFLRKKNINIDGSPNTRVEDDVVELLMNEFKQDKNLKPQTPRAPKPAPQAPKAEPAPKPEHVEVKAEPAAGPRILGTLELDKKGNPVVNKPEAPKPAPAPVEA
ncbi:MAG: translation initiation factor IF-2 N-terminal domain-containing protein, partial [Muribaculaceae bacterium]|nr:translation initiation factor IF-2 N-terminal domain-containing protein [Muribaculaceae bacterium]